MSELIITNGDSAADLLRAAGLASDVLPWRDVLHEGPVPEADRLESHSSLRAKFLAYAFDEDPNEIIREMEERDRTLRDATSHDRIVLWFEHDLYDQLQLLQLLDFFHGETDTPPLELVQADDYLGRQTPESIGRFQAQRAAVTDEQKTLASNIFQAFQQSTPEALAGFLDKDLSPLPHMKAALKRLFEDLPDSRNGLSRTQHQILTMIDHQGLPPGKLFGAVQAMEEAMFMGDVSFWRCLEDMAFNTRPLIDGLPCRFSANIDDAERRRYLQAPLALSETGSAVLEGDMDHAAVNVVDRWLGGTHIVGDTIWRWDRRADILVPPA